MRHINADHVHTHFICLHKRRARATKRIKDNVAGLKINFVFEIILMAVNKIFNKLRNKLAFVRM